MAFSLRCFVQSQHNGITPFKLSKTNFGAGRPEPDLQRHRGILRSFQQKLYEGKIYIVLKQ